MNYLALSSKVSLAQDCRLKLLLPFKMQHLLETFSLIHLVLNLAKTTHINLFCRTGISPVIFNVFVSLPMNSTMLAYMQSVVPQIAAARAIVLLTVEPDQGFAAVTSSSVQSLASYITQYEQV